MEEQIGDVNTGLTEEFILKNLRTSKYIPWLKPSLSDKESKSDRENEACVICQVCFILTAHERLWCTYIFLASYY